MNLEQLKQAWAAKVAEARKAAEASDPAKANALLDEADALQKQIADLEGQQAKVSEMQKRLDTVTEQLKRIETEPALRNAGIVSGAGGKSDPDRKSFADFLMAVYRKDAKRLTEVYHSQRDTEDDKSGKALGEASGTAGGYTVPPEFAKEIFALAAEDEIVYPNAYKQPMAARSVTIPYLDQVTAPTAGNTSFFGGVVGGWLEEAGSLPETEPKFQMMELVAHKLGGYTKASEELRDDSAIGIEALLKRLFAGAVAWYRDYAFLRGNGVGKPLGIQNSAAAIANTRAGTGAELVDLASMLAQLLPSSHKKAMWVAHPFVIAPLIQLALSNATIVSWVGSLKEGVPATLLGLPLRFSEKMAASMTSFDLLLADFSYYVIGDRKSLSIEFSDQAFWTTQQVAWRFSCRVDGQPWLRGPITLADASSQVSPFVYLD